jgi:hypothetical protein
VLISSGRATGGGATLVPSDADQVEGVSGRGLLAFRFRDVAECFVARIGER